MAKKKFDLDTHLHHMSSKLEKELGKKFTIVPDGNYILLPNTKKMRKVLETCMLDGSKKMSQGVKSHLCEGCTDKKTCEQILEALKNTKTPKEDG